jgi:hypothetical protein
MLADLLLDELALLLLLGYLLANLLLLLPHVIHQVSHLVLLAKVYFIAPTLIELLQLGYPGPDHSHLL